MKQLVSTIAFLSLFNVVGMQEFTEEVTRSMEKCDITEIIHLECQCRNSNHREVAEGLTATKDFDDRYFQQFCGLINDIIKSRNHESCMDKISWYIDMYNKAPVINQYLNDLYDSSGDLSTEGRETAEVGNNSVVQRRSNPLLALLSQDDIATLMGILSYADDNGVLVSPSDELWDRAIAVAREIASLWGRAPLLDNDRGFESMIVEVDVCRGYGSRVNARFIGVEPKLKKFFFNLYVLDNAITEQACRSLIDTFLRHEDKSCSNAIFLSAVYVFKLCLPQSDEPSSSEDSTMHSSSMFSDLEAGANVVEGNYVGRGANALVINPMANTLMSNIITAFDRLAIGNGDVHHYDGFVVSHWNDFRNFVDEMINANPIVPLLSLDSVFNHMRNNLHIEDVKDRAILNNAISHFPQRQDFRNIFVRLYSLASGEGDDDFRSRLVSQLMENSAHSTRGAYCFEGYRNRLFFCAMSYFGSYIRR